jgi:hypothetical protein
VGGPPGVLEGIGEAEPTIDPDDAAFADMPRQALNAAGADYVASSREMPSLLDRLVRQG